MLASLDASKLDYAKAQQLHRTDKDFPVAWSKTLLRKRKGRVFYSTRYAAKRDDPRVQKMYLEAIKWSMGLTNGDTTPRPKPARAQ